MCIRDRLKAIALGADAGYIATSALLALGCHLCRSCQTGKCNWGIATQRPELVKRLNPDIGSQRLIDVYKRQMQAGRISSRTISDIVSASICSVL